MQRALFDAYEDGRQEWLLLSDCFIWSHRYQILIKIPQWFITDFASIPRIARFLFTGHGKTRYPSLPHDLIYAFAQSGLINLTRKEADLILLDMCFAREMGRWATIAVYSAVRAGGLGSWKKDKRIKFASPDLISKYQEYHRKALN